MWISRGTDCRWVPRRSFRSIVDDALALCPARPTHHPYQAVSLSPPPPLNRFVDVFALFLLQLVGVASLWIASKYVEEWRHEVTAKDMATATGERLTLEPRMCWPG